MRFDLPGLDGACRVCSNCPPLRDGVGCYCTLGGADKAGGYAIQGLASRFVRRIEGSYSNVVGLPISTVYGLLRAAGGTGDLP